MSPEPTRQWIAIGTRIRTARVAVGLSQEALANAIGTSRRHVIRLERGEHRPSRPMLARIAEATGQDPQSIDPDATEGDMQLASVFLELLDMRVRDVVRAELRSAAAEGRRAA